MYVTTFRKSKVLVVREKEGVHSGRQMLTVPAILSLSTF